MASPKIGAEKQRTLEQGSEGRLRQQLERQQLEIGEQGSQPPPMDGSRMEGLEGRPGVQSPRLARRQQVARWVEQSGGQRVRLAS